MRIVKIVVSIAILALGAYGLLIEPSWVEVTYHRIQNGGRVALNGSWSAAIEPGSDSSPRHFRIVQVSDLHLHRIGRTEEAVIEKINALQPNLLLLTGDVADRPESLPVLDSFLTKVATKHKFAVLGNWEYWGDVDLQELRLVYQRHGTSLLINECVELANEGVIYQIAGLDDFTAGNPDERKVYDQCKNGPTKQTAPTNGFSKRMILLQHSPGYSSEKKPIEPPPHWLALSGHTHGGQVLPFGFPLWTPPGSGPFVSGWYVTDYGDLYVSRGLGTSIVPIRFGSRPEIAVFDTL